MFSRFGIITMLISWLIIWVIKIAGISYLTPIFILMSVSLVLLNNEEKLNGVMGIIYILCFMEDIFGNYYLGTCGIIWSILNVIFILFDKFIPIRGTLRILVLSPIVYFIIRLFHRGFLSILGNSIIPFSNVDVFQNLIILLICGLVVNQLTIVYFRKVRI